jgi:hypothetical protein
VEEEIDIDLGERAGRCLLALYGFGHALLRTPPDQPLTDAEREQVRATMSELEEARRRVAVAWGTLNRIAVAVRNRHMGN